MKVADVVGVAAGCMLHVFFVFVRPEFFRTKDATTEDGAVCVAQRVFEFWEQGKYPHDPETDLLVLYAGREVGFGRIRTRHKFDNNQKHTLDEKSRQGRLRGNKLPLHAGTLRNNDVSRWEGASRDNEAYPHRETHSIEPFPSPPPPPAKAVHQVTSETARHRG